MMVNKLDLLVTIYDMLDKYSTKFIEATLCEDDYDRGRNFGKVEAISEVLILLKGWKADDKMDEKT